MRSFLMSEKKSWDVERKPAVPAQARPLAGRATGVASKPVSKSAKQDTRKVITRARTRPTVSGEPLRARRARAKRVFYSGLGVLSVVLVAVLFYGAWMPALRITDVVAEGPDFDDIQRIAQEQLQGTHFLLVPRNSIFFVPESSIRKNILSQHPAVSAVSFKSNGLNGLSVTAVSRTSAFLWCGDTHAQPRDICYRTDAEGLIFAPYTDPEPLASSTLLLRVYVPLSDNAVEPIRAHIGYASSLPNALRFAKTLRTLGANIAEFAIRDDEADFYTQQGTRITYVIGHEGQSAQLAASVFPALSLNDGSVEYIDLRFEGKAVLRRSGVAQ